jgi:hypothetical protein
MQLLVLLYMTLLKKPHKEEFIGGLFLAKATYQGQEASASFIIL